MRGSNSLSQALNSNSIKIAVKCLTYLVYLDLFALFIFQKYIEQKKEGETMTFSEYHDRKIPEYYKTMESDGYSAEAVLYALRRQMWRSYQERQAQQNQTHNVHITSEVKIRK